MYIKILIVAISGALAKCYKFLYYLKFHNYNTLLLQ